MSADKAHLRRTVAPLPDVYRFGDAELDFGRCELRRAGKVIELSALESKLLAADARIQASMRFTRFVSRPKRSRPWSFF